MPNLYRILHVLIIVGQQDYAKSVLKHILILSYQETNSDVVPFWDACVQRPYVMNEEVGEISLSMLCRSLQSDTKLRDVAHVAGKYRSIADTYNQLSSSDLLSNVKGFCRTRSSRIIAKDESLYTHVNDFQGSLLNKIVGGDCTMYASDDAYHSKDAAARFLTDAAPQTYDVDVVAEVRKLLHKEKAALRKAYFKRNVDLAPELTVQAMERFVQELQPDFQLTGSHAPSHSPLNSGENSDIADGGSHAGLLSGSVAAASDDDLPPVSDDDEFDIPRGYVDSMDISPAKRPGFLMINESVDVEFMRTSRKRERRPSRALIQSLESQSRFRPS